MSHNDPVPPGSLPVLDLDGACEFLELTRPEIMILVPQALIEIRDKLELARQELKAENIPATGRHAHTIKSVAASIGAESTRQAAEDLEHHAKTPTPDNCARLIQSIERETTRLAHTIAALP